VSPLSPSLPPLPPNLSLGVASYHDQLVAGRMSPIDFLDEAVRLGFRTVELCDRTVTLPTLPAIADALAARGLTCPSLALRNSFCVSSSLLATIDYLRTWLDALPALGVRLARIWTGTESCSPVARADVGYGLTTVARHARRVGLRLTVETHGGLSNDVDFLLGIVDRLGPTVGVCPDFGNLPRATHLDDVTRLAPVTNHAHVKGLEFDEDGRETTLRLDECIATLVEAGFDGLWVVEYEGSPPEELGVQRTVAVLRGVLEGVAHR
jgi:sugar phosphate isomerase/epimerase